MKPIVFDFSNSSLSRKSESIALKAGYLLGDVVYSAGSAGVDVRFGEISLRYNIFHKIHMLEKVFHNKPDMLDCLVKIKKTKKEADKVKDKAPELIITQRKAEAVVEDLFKDLTKWMEERINGFGYEAVRNLDDDILRYYTIDPASPETPVFDNITVSNLLQRLLPDIKEDEEPEIFFLGAEFFKDNYSEYSLYTDENDLAINTQNTSLYKCFSLPDFTFLSADELKEVRKDIQQASATFREHMNEWIDMCYFGDAIPDRLSYFTKNVMPAITGLQQTVNENDILKACGDMQGNDEKIELWIGEMPVQQLWDYYRHYKVVNDCTWSKIEHLKTDEDYLNQRWPVLILNVPESMLVATMQEETPVEEIKASKKYILID